MFAIKMTLVIKEYLCSYFKPDIFHPQTFIKLTLYPLNPYCGIQLLSGSITLGKPTFVIAPAYSRVRYRSPNFFPSVRSFVRSSVRSFVRQHLRRSLVFSTSEIAASLKPCIVIVPDIPFKHAP